MTRKRALATTAECCDVARSKLRRRWRMPPLLCWRTPRALMISPACRRCEPGVLHVCMLQPPLVCNCGTEDSTMCRWRVLSQRHGDRIAVHDPHHKPVMELNYRRAAVHAAVASHLRPCS